MLAGPRNRLLGTSYLKKQEIIIVVYGSPFCHCIKLLELLPSWLTTGAGIPQHVTRDALLEPADLE